ncbi:MAG: DUF3473 domain-containing protein [Sedimentisphaerales bacterium]|nr:DUF3473 domain-containing protein [Sedimentisphaerales bacterium]
MAEEVSIGRLNAFSCEIEDWFHILDSDRVPSFVQWSKLPLRADRGVGRLLDLFDATQTKATFFCLGWMAERMPGLIRRCHDAGHEIASHGYAHLLAYQVGPKAFLQDLIRSKAILEDIIGQEVIGLRCPGFGITEQSMWVFDLAVEAGFHYDSSMFPAHHAHGGLRTKRPYPHVIHTFNGPLVEVPISTIRIFGRRYCMFGGGYLRITPLATLKWAVKRLRRQGMPLVVYTHPREVDPDHPRLPLGSYRSFKAYVNIHGTFAKLQWLCSNIRFGTMSGLASTVLPLQVSANAIS